MSDYVTISGTLINPINTPDSKFPNTIITITSLDFTIFNQIPVKREIRLTENGQYNFQLLKGSTYEVTIQTKPQAGTTGYRNNITFGLEIPSDIDDSISYDLYRFVVTNFSPLLEHDDVRYARFIQDQATYYLYLINNRLMIEDTTNTRLKTVKNLFPRGGLLNNNSFEYDLLDEDFNFEPLILNNGANVNVSYNGDIPDNMNNLYDVYNIVEETRSLDLEIVNSGSDIDDIILRQKLQPNVLVPNQTYRLRGSFKLVDGTPISDIQIEIKNSYETLISFDNITLDEYNNGWNFYESIIKNSDDEFLVYSSQNIYFQIKLGNIGDNIRIRLDELVLEEYFNY